MRFGWQCWRSHDHIKEKVSTAIKMGEPSSPAGTWSGSAGGPAAGAGAWGAGSTDPGWRRPHWPGWAPGRTRRCMARGGMPAGGRAAWRAACVRQQRTTTPHLFTLRSRSVRVVLHFFQLFCPKSTRFQHVEIFCCLHPDHKTEVPNQNCVFCIMFFGLMLCLSSFL